MIEDRRERKQRGRWGESMVDRYMATVGFQVALENKVFRGGEIDRLYVRNCSYSNTISVCIVEVKTSSVRSVCDLVGYADFANLVRFVKARQIQNLKKFGEHFAARLQENGNDVLLHARLFLVVRVLAKNGLKECELTHFPGKICLRSSGYWVLSVDPDVASGGSVYR
jgi:Holliday junction resolvase-like predicted endonuclease